MSVVSLLVVGISNSSKIFFEGSNLPILFALYSTTHTMPERSTAISVGELKGVGMGNSSKGVSSEAKTGKTEDRRQKTENRGQKTEDRRESLTSDFLFLMPSSS